MSKKRIIFLGTPAFAVPALKSLIENNFNVIAVITQPDKAGDRGKVFFSAVKEFALTKNLPIYQFENLNQDEQVIRDLKPDIMITAAYGQIIRKNILDICPIFNIHASILPKYRGAAPINAAIINGEKETGITIMKTEEGLDCGDIYLIKKLKIGPNETAGELMERLSNLGAIAITEFLSTSTTPTKQNESKATHFGTMKKEFGLITDFKTKTASEWHDFIRGLNPWPTAHLKIEDKIFKIHESTIYSGTTTGIIPHFVVLCKNKTYLELVEVQLEGKKRMNAKEFFNGTHIKLQ